MAVKKVTEKTIKNSVRRIFKKILSEQEYAFIILISIFTMVLFYKPTIEKLVAYVFSLCALQFAILKDEERILRIKIKKNNMK